MLQSALARQPLVIVGALGLLAGVLVAHQMTTAPALAADPLPVAGAVSPAAPLAIDAPAAAPTAPVAPAAPAGIVFLDSRPAETPGPVAAAAPQAGPTAIAPQAALVPQAAAPATPSGSGGFMRIVLMTTFLVVGVLAWYLTRRRNQGKSGGASKALSLVGTVKIAGRWQVALVKVPGKTLVLGATDKGLSLLSELDDDVTLEQEDREDRDDRDDREDRDDLAARIRNDDTMSFGRSKLDAPRGRTSRVSTDPLGTRAARSDASPGFVAAPPAPPQPSAEPFSRLLDQLTRGGPSTTPPAARERSKTDEAVALRARLERHQPTN